MAELLTLLFFAIIIGVPLYIHFLRSKIKGNAYEMEKLNGTLNCKTDTISDLKKSIDFCRVRIEQLEIENRTLQSSLDRASSLTITAPTSPPSHEMQELLAQNEKNLGLIEEKDSENRHLSNRILSLLNENRKLEKELQILRHASADSSKIRADSFEIRSELSTSKVELDNTKARLNSLYEDHNSLKAWVIHTKELSRALLPRNQKEYTWCKDIDCTRLHHAFDENIQHSNILIQANYVSSKDDTEYETTLTSCTCPDFKYNTQGKPCKHMYTLALELGIFLLPNHEALRSDLTQCTKLKSEIDRERADIQKIVNTRSQSSPWLADRIADYYNTIDNKRIDAIPRTTKKEELKRISKEKRDATFKAKMFESQLSYLTHTFPWLEDFITDPPTKEMLAEPTGDTEWDNLKDWISATEYANLSTVEKYQLALDRYESRARSAWEAGIMYERYVGWVYESHDFDVEYRGALDGYDDMGRDIIAKKDGRVYVIQCKRWDKHKTIHEKHIFQLYGSTILYRIDHPKETVIPLFVTTTALSECASAVAHELNVTVREDLPLKPYPKIKCNIGKNGEKIYHLPFDQQYDRVIIDKKKGEGYCMTVAEAESLGFRRAHKWISN